MKLLLIGPYPPPHGGISVHVIEARKKLQQAGFEVQVLNTNRGAPPSSEYLRYQNNGELIGVLWKLGRQGWTFHVHTNGHNRKSWLLALLCGMISKLGSGGLLTLHSGMTPAYLESSLRRFVGRAVCSLYDRVIGVNVEILNALEKSGVPAGKLDVLPAYLAANPSPELPSQLRVFFREHWPVFTTVLFFRPEYGFEFMLKGLSRLQKNYPRLGCLFMGDGETSVEARLAILQEKIGESILLLGDVPHDLCLAAMARSDAFLRCTFSDGDSISVREALSAGVPVVASDVGHRPSGVVPFPAGNLDAFLSSVETALGDRKNNSRSIDLQTTGFSKLLEMYKDLHPEEAR